MAFWGLLDRTNPITAALMAKMHIEPGERVRVKLACLRMLAQLQLDPARRELISGFVDAYLCLTMEQGLEQGERKLVLRQLRKRLGALDRETELRIEALSPEGLEQLGEALLDFSRPDDLEAWLEAHG
jgi:Domain of unknown function (DUF4351)